MTTQRTGAQPRLFFLTAFAVILLLTTVCPSQADGLPPFDSKSIPPQPNYSQTDSWLALPESSNRFAVDVFWVYPTILHNNTDWLMDITSPEQQSAAAATLYKQAAVFSCQANLYAPYYRQMNMAALGLGAKQQSELIAYGLDDVWAAFTYYLKHCNQGRPFILAGHSQGSNIIVDLAIRHWGSTNAEDRLVAAYAIGWSITEKDLAANPSIHICESPNQTNCFINYNTMAAGRQEAAPTRAPGAIVVNPLSWTTNDSFVPASRNMGATFADHDRSETRAHFTSAQIVDSGLVVAPADLTMMPAAPGFPKGVYHVYDYALFFENLRTNAAQRIQQMLVKGH
jgi:pimeloyl-ACP methyl ester carboxylesterase